MDFTDKGAKKFAEDHRQARRASSRRRTSSRSSSTARSSPTLGGARRITGGSAEISGSFTQQSAEDLGNMLSYGALPLSFRSDSVTTVTAALGGEQLQAGLIAGAIGLALVIIYLVAYYRGLALVALAQPAGLRRS